MKQAEAEVGPSSSLIEVEVEVGVWVKMQFSFLTFLGGWLEIWRVKLISTQFVVEVEVGVELGNNNQISTEEGTDRKTL